MTISEMHKMFRTLGQQKGMELVRAIVPNEIDDFLNAAIIEFCRQILIKGASTQYQMNINAADNQTITINSLSTLYKESTIGEENVDSTYKEFEDTINDAFEYLSFVIVYNEDNPSNYVPTRLIDNNSIGFVLNDFCNAPDVKHPIVTKIIGTNGSIFRVYFGSNPKTKVILKANYIKFPATVSKENSIDCDLPEHVHQEIVELAIKKYIIAVSNTSSNVKQ